MDSIDLTDISVAYGDSSWPGVHMDEDMIDPRADSPDNEIIVKINTASDVSFSFRTSFPVQAVTRPRLYTTYLISRNAADL